MDNDVHIKSTFFCCREISAAYLVVGILQASSLRQLKADTMHSHELKTRDSGLKTRDSGLKTRDSGYSVLSISYFFCCREISAAYLVVGIVQASSLRQLKADTMHSRELKTRDSGVTS
ncbi:hypothetical protein A0256_12215 [Mucilaginibacter sp. PAMC 26640]|nr:hypothetical protein A0256_12215 [Mucilaginibacter sp. PAMC 26640]